MGADNSDELDANIITPSLRGAILALFFAGMALGGFLFAYKSAPMQIAFERCNTCDSLSERCAANHLALIFSVHCSVLV